MKTKAKDPGLTCPSLLRKFQLVNWSLIQGSKATALILMKINKQMIKKSLLGNTHTTYFQNQLYNSHYPPITSSSLIQALN